MRGVALVFVLVGCGSREVPKQCIYRDAAYSLGATLCMPSMSVSKGHTITECRDMGQAPEWRDTQTLCTPTADAPAPTTPDAGSGAR